MNSKIQNDFIETTLRFREAKFNEVKDGIEELERLDEILSRYGVKPTNALSGSFALKTEVRVKEAAERQLSLDEQMSTAEWIRWAIEQLDEVTNPKIIEEIGRESGNSVNVSGARLSTELYGYAKRGEIEVIREIPGGPKIYRKTEKFRPFRQYTNINVNGVPMRVSVDSISHQNGSGRQ